uniref:Uncharacterized protein n=1 Tax=Meloidogyne enterolobii TaxID=390850 RepID=A0A6V7VFI5_MELEN|nr:unnamed protein product [Meloidogyne enterolobii]
MPTFDLYFMGFFALFSFLILPVLAYFGQTSGFVYRCPITVAPTIYIPPYGINYCGTGSLFHYYICCDYNPTECCLQLEPWLMLALIILGLLSLCGCVGCLLCFIAQRK